MATPVAGSQQAKWFAALDRARLTGAKPTYKLGKDYYTVTSPRAGDTYEIHPIAVGSHITYACTCKAGQRDLICWHKALVASLPFECQRRQAYKAKVH